MPTIEASELTNTYQEKGFFYPITVLDSKEIEYYKSLYDQQKALLGKDTDPNRFKQLHLHFPWAYKLVTHPTVLKHVTSLLGKNVLVHGSSVFSKSPGDETYVSWHQDGYYLKLKSFEYVSAWIALSDSTVENGCMRFVPNSHQTILPHIENPNSYNLLGSGLTVDKIIADNDVVDVKLRAGEMSLHHVNLLHSSNPNVSDEKRVGFAVRYISANFSQELPHHKVVLASGNYNESNFDLLQSPPSGSLENCIKKQKIAHDQYRHNRQFNSK